MGRKVQTGIICLLALLAAALSLPAQNAPQEDSLVYLMKGTSLQLIEKFGRNYRKAVDATFLHNGTYLICDTALWDVDRKTIKAEGHVKVIQGETELSSETLDYLIDEDLAKFRGGVVQLRNKENNILRTKYLDYNTKDSVAIFKNGASMKDSDGQVIESIDGTYDSAAKLFTFDRNVNMYTDTTFVKTSKLLYDSAGDVARFVSPIDFWKDGDMLSAGEGWYDRANETFFFYKNVHAMTENQEVWCDSLYFYRALNNVEMFGNVQVQDSSRSVAGMAEYMFYCDSTAQMTMKHRAAIAVETDQDGQKDTLYFGADTLIYRTIPRCDIHADEVKASETRMKDMMMDPVMEFRRKAAEEARRAAEEAAKNDPNIAGQMKAAAKGGDAAESEAKGAPEVSDSVKNDADTIHVEGTVPFSDSLSDSLALPDSILADTDSLLQYEDSMSVVADSVPDTSVDVEMPVIQIDSVALADSLEKARLKHIADSLANRDTTKIGFMWGIRNVRIFRKDMQVLCDSMRYCDLDSIARFYIDPIVWNDGNRQYTSDSLFVLVKDGGIDRASLMSNAFIITQEDSLFFDQIKGTDVMAYFDSTAALTRFDALGGASAIFFLQENDQFATVNKVESKMLSALMTDGTLSRVYYFESPKNDAFPLAQIKSTDLQMKGFNWNPEARPTGPQDITTLKVKPLERSRYSRRVRPPFRYTDVYFPGYMQDLQKRLSAPRPKPARKSPLSEPQDSSAVQDSLAAASDSLSAIYADSLTVQVDSVIAVADSLAVSSVTAPADSIQTSVAVDVPKTPVDKAEFRKERKEQREEARKLRIARRDARWAELDARDAAKAEAAAQKALEKKRERTRKAYLKQAGQDSVDEAKLQKYIERYEKRKARDERKQQSVTARKRSPRVETGRDLQTSPES